MERIKKNNLERVDIPTVRKLVISLLRFAVGLLVVNLLIFPHYLLINCNKKIIYFRAMQVEEEKTTQTDKQLVVSKL